MDYDGTESPLVAAQRNAIQQIRGRYERGELPFDAFRQGLDAITSAQSPEECAAILRDLPAMTQLPHASALAALEPIAPAPPAPAFPSTSVARSHISAFMSETKKTRNGWTLAPDTRVRAMMGSIRLDLRRARLPAQARMRVNATMSEVVILIPDDVSVTVHSSAFMSEVVSLGESIAGVIATGEEDYVPVGVAPRAHLEIDARTIMGSVHIMLVGMNDIPSIAEFARETYQSVLEGLRRGWEQSARDAQLPPANVQPGLPKGQYD